MQEVTTTQEQATPLNTPDHFYRARVLKILSEDVTNLGGETTPVQNLLVEITDETGKTTGITINHGSTYTITNDQKLKEGQSIIVNESAGPNGNIYNIYDNDRSGPMLLLCGLFMGIVLITTRKKGLGALIGLGVSLMTLIYFIVPFVIKGYSPSLISLAGAVIIASTSLFLAHGFKRSTYVAWIATIATLLIAMGLAKLSILLLHMTGAAAEETLLLSISGFENIELKGLLLGGMIIGTLGVLDDVTTAQVVAVNELKIASPNISNKQVIKHAFAIGKEHILAVVNTLVLAYAGGALPLFIIFTATTDTPLWVLLNNELVVEEVVRALVGSIALILAVPISTVLAAQYIKKGEELGHGH